MTEEEKAAAALKQEQEEKDAKEEDGEVEDLDLSEVKDDDEVDVEKLKADKKKAEELANNYKIRAEKAEKALPKKKEDKVAEEKGLSTSDVYVLLKNDVPEEDIPEVSDYATLKKISIAEALKSPIVKSILANKAEERKTADATSTGNQRRANNRPTGETLLAKASKGDMPDSDADLEALFKARKGIK